MKSNNNSNNNNNNNNNNSISSSIFSRIGEVVSRPVPGMVRAKETNRIVTSTTSSSSGPSSSSSSSSSSLSGLKTPSTPPSHSISNNTSVNTGKLQTPSSSSSLSSLSFSNIPKSTSNDTITTHKPYRLAKFEQILHTENVDLDALRKLSWSGIPSQFRTIVWQLLLGYMPANKSRREQAITRKRKEYVESIPIYFDTLESDRTTQEGETLRQILVDLPRTSPDTPFFQQHAIQHAMKRILFIWSSRHPASSYVQGMNDLLTPLLLVCMYPYFNDVLRCDVEQLGSNVLMEVEADAYWCLSKLLDGIQDHYTFSQPGVQRMVLRLEDLMNRIDADLHNHFNNEGVLYMQFSFRWMNCLLLREIPLKAMLRVWDTCLAEDSGGFENFHVYVCAVLLQTFKETLLTMQFQDIIMFLQEMPTSEWGEEDVEPILSQAFILSTLFDNSSLL